MRKRKLKAVRRPKNLIRTAKRGKSAVPARSIAPNGLPTVQIHLVVTRQSGDTERYLMAEVRNMLYAIEYRRKLARVSIPQRLTSKDLREAA